MSNEALISSRQVNNTPYDEYTNLINELVSKGFINQNQIANLTRDYQTQMKAYTITQQDIELELEALKLNKKDESPVVMLNTALSRSVDAKIKKEKVPKQKNKIKVEGSIKSAKKNIMTTLNSNTLNVSFKSDSKTIFSESNSQPYPPSSYNSHIISLSPPKCDEYSLIPKDEWENSDDYRKYFMNVKQNLLKSLDIKEDDPLLDVNKFVLVVIFETSEYTPKLEDVYGVNPLAEYEKFSLKFENIDTNSEGYYFVSGAIMYFEGELKNNKELYVKAYEKGFPLLTYTIQEQFVRAYFEESAPYLIFSMNGPYYAKDNLDLGIFLKTLSIINSYNPHLLIINGPLVYSENEKIKSGFLGEDIENGSTYIEFFTEMLQAINEIFKGNELTQILIVPSLTDELNYYPLPQPPYNFNENKLIQNLDIIVKGRLQFSENPNLFQINEMIWGIANYDIIKDMTANCVKSKNKSIIDSALETVLHQKSLYPILQNTIHHEDAEKMEKIITTDISQLYKFSFDTFPDLIITTSGMVPFIKKINSTIFINSGPMFKGKNPYSIAKIVSYPPSVRLYSFNIFL